ncbi:hypothetical protein Hrd1104_04215 [Halorhabdus sp. CBA1104]|uniref:hypothetical protein n=1 Tax=Halorhabdus sp. CBA1104 TaxID=1380432 RepID=UPI0012B20388|nr:hypothetical protein [Halorhabdus sp. CBA1104]QGN06578.1 hypothetical protein Hrd1104_04215 [Halorhabdus sp. CBA1104]
MVSRENTVYGTAVVGAFALLVVIAVASPPDWLAGVGLVGYYAVGVGAGHLYLARRSETGDLAVGSHWRFLAALGCWLTLGAFGLFGPEWQLRGLETDTVLTVAGLGVLIVYWLLEARDGYLTSRPS